MSSSPGFDLGPPVVCLVQGAGPHEHSPGLPGRAKNGDIVGAGG